MPAAVPSTATKESMKQLAELTDHSGTNPKTPAEFFVPPPRELGKIWTAESTLGIGRGPRGIVFRLMVSLAPAILVFLVAVILVNQKSPSDADSLSTYVITAIPAAIVFALVMFVTRYKIICSYVGDNGVAKFTVTGNRHAQPMVMQMLFADAEELKAGQIRQFVNGLYAGTNYTYTWSNHQGEKIFRLSGKYQGKKKPPKQGDPFHFARMSELAWSQHYLGRAQQLLNDEGSIPFRVDKSRWLRIGPGFIEFHFDANPVRVTKEEIASVTLGNGVFGFKHKDAKWLSRAGKYNFSYGGMANAKVFLLAMDKLMRYRWN